MAEFLGSATVLSFPGGGTYISVTELAPFVVSGLPDGIAPLFARADPRAALEGNDEDHLVADAVGPRAVEDGVHGRLDAPLVDGRLRADLLGQVDLDVHPAAGLVVAILLPPAEDGAFAKDGGLRYGRQEPSPSRLGRVC